MTGGVRRARKGSGFSGSTFIVGIDTTSGSWDATTFGTVW